MKRLWLVVFSLAVVSGCRPTPDSAIGVTINVAAALKGDCIELAVLTDGVERKSLVLARTAMKTTYSVGIRRGEDLPVVITVEARAYLGTCSDQGNLKINARSERATRTFPAEGVESVELKLDPPDSTTDADRDGYVSGLLGGADCDDTVDTTFPGAVQRCDVELDNDCDGVAACADSECSAASECVQPPTKLVFTGAPTTIERGQCSGAVTVELQNALGARAAVATTTVSLTSAPAAVTYFSDATCTTAITDTTIPFQQTSGTVYLRGTLAGDTTLTAAAAGLTDAISSLSVTPVPLASLAFTNPPRTVTAASCVDNELTIELRDARGQPTTLPSDVTVSLSASPNDADGNFSTDGCTTQTANSVVIARGQSSATFRVVSKRAGPMEVTARVTTAATYMATQAVTITPAAAAMLAFANQALSLGPSTCSAGPLQIEIQDVYGNQAPSGVSRTLSLVGGLGLQFFRDSSCTTSTTTSPLTLNAMDRGVQVYVRSDTMAGQTMVTVSDGNVVLPPASQTLYVSAGPPTHLQVDSLAQTAEAGVCSAQAIILTARNSSNGLASFAQDTAVTLSTSPAVATLTFFTQPGCPAQAQVTTTATFPANQTQLSLYFRGTVAPSTFSLTATPQAAGVTAATLAGNTITVGPPASVIVTPASQTVTAGACSTAFSIALRDAYANAASFPGASNLTFSSSPMGVTWGSSSSSCAGTTALSVSGGSSTATGFLTANTTGTYSVTTTVGTLSASPLSLTVNPGTSTGLQVFQPMAGASVVAGGCLGALVGRRDAQLNPVPVGGSGATLSFPTVPTGVTFYDSLANCMSQTSPQPTFTVGAMAADRAFYIRATQAGSTSVTASLLGQLATLTFTVAPAAAATLEFVGLPASRASDVCSGSVSLTRRDPFGNLATADGALSGTVTVPAGVQVYETANCTGSPGTSANISFAMNQGASSAVSMKAAGVGTYPVNAVAGALSAMQNFTVTAGAAAKLVFLTAGSSVTAGDCVSNVQVQVQDANGNPVMGARTIALASSYPVTFHSDASCTTTVTSVPTGGTAIGTFAFKPLLVPQSTLTVTASSTVPTTVTAAMQTWTTGPASAAKLAWKTGAAPPATLTRFTCTASPVTVQLQDTYGNVVNAGSGGVTVNFSTTGGNAGIGFYDSGCMNVVASRLMAQGSSEVDVYLLGVGGTMASTVHADAMSLTGVTMMVSTTGTAGSLVVTMANTQLEAGGCLPVTVERRFMSVAYPKGVTQVDLSSNNAGVTLHAMSDCSGAGAANLPLSFGEGVSQVTVYARGRSVASTTTVRLTATDATAGFASGFVDLTTYPLVRRGTCTISNGNYSCASTALDIPGLDINRTFLVFQARSTATTASDANTECHLEASGTVVVRCNRQGNPNISVDVVWQAVSWGRGVLVRHSDGLFPTADDFLDAGIAAVDTTQSFVLFGSRTSGMTNDTNDFPIARLASADNVVIQNTGTFPTPEGGFALQVVEMAGARVARGQAVLNASSGVGTIVHGLSNPDLSRLSPLLSARSETGGASDHCKRRLNPRTESSGNGDLTISRGSDGGATCFESALVEVAWEVIEWPAGTMVYSREIAFSPSSPSGTAVTWTPSPALVSHRTLLYFAGQGPGGQCSIEGSNTDDTLGKTCASTEINAAGTTVTLSRNQNGHTAKGTVYAIQFAP